MVGHAKQVKRNRYEHVKRGVKIDMRKKRFNMRWVQAMDKIIIILAAARVADISIMERRHCIFI